MLIARHGQQLMEARRTIQSIMKPVFQRYQQTYTCCTYESFRCLYRSPDQAIFVLMMIVNRQRQIKPITLPLAIAHARGIITTYNGVDSSGSEVDVSYSRLVEFYKKDGVRGLKIYQRGPTVWTPIALRTSGFCKI